MFRNRSILLPTLTTALLALTPMAALAMEDSFDSAGVPIYYEDMGGDGEPVVLVHSFTSDSEMWTKAGFEPSDDFRFIALDVRGHGQSGKPADPDAYGAEMAEDVVRLMDHLGLEDAHLAGYSMGAEIALKVATEHPDRVRSVVAGGSGWSPIEAFDVYAYAADSLETAPSYGEMVRSMMPPEVPAEQIAFFLDSMAAHGIDLENEDTAPLASVARSMAEIIPLAEEDVAAIDLPVLGIAAETDSELGWIERMDGVVPEFTMVRLEGATGDPDLDHLGATLDPLFEQAIVDFLSQQSGLES